MIDQLPVTVDALREQLALERAAHEAQLAEERERHDDIVRDLRLRVATARQTKRDRRVGSPGTRLQALKDNLAAFGQSPDSPLMRRLLGATATCSPIDGAEHVSRIAITVLIAREGIGHQRPPLSLGAVSEAASDSKEVRP